VVTILIIFMRINWKKLISWKLLQWTPVHGVTVKVRSSSNNKHYNVYSQKVGGGAKHRASPPLQKVGGHVPVSTHGSTPLVVVAAAVTLKPKTMSLADIPSPFTVPSLNALGSFVLDRHTNRRIRTPYPRRLCRSSWVIRLLSAAEMPAEAKAPTTRSFRAWCLDVLPNSSFTDEAAKVSCIHRRYTTALVWNT